MDYQKLYNKYHSRLVWEGVVKALACGFSIGVGIGGIIALVAWFAEFNGLWISLGCFVGITAALAPVFYYKVFCPDEIAVARRLDSLGLQERMITMQEFKNEASGIAALQRKDALVTVCKTAGKASTAARRIFHISAKTVTAFCVEGALSVGLATLIGLCDFGLIPSGKALLGAAFAPRPEQYMVNYDYVGGAILTGNDSQRVNEGGSTEEVLYTADRDYYFISWTDSYGNQYFDGPSRHEDNVLDDVDLEARFDEYDPLSNDPELSRELNSSAGGGGGGSSTNPGNDSNDGNQNDEIIDGNTDYHVHYDQAYNDIMNYLASNPDISAEDRAMIEAYIKALK